MDIENFEKIVWVERYDEFMNIFCNSYGVIMDLINVWWNTSTMKIYFVLESGQHMSDEIPIKKWCDFINNVETR